MKCTKCNSEVPSSYMKCPNCGQGFYGASSSSSFNMGKQTQQPSPYGAQVSNANVSSSQNAQHHQSHSNNLNLPFATFASRFFALIIDTCIIIVPAMILGALIGVWGMIWDDSDLVTSLKIQIVGIFFGILYEALFISGAWQATPGKRLMGLKVIDTSGNPVTFWRAVGRSASKLLSSIFFIGYIMAAFTKDKQALHDLMAGTFVVKG